MYPQETYEGPTFPRAFGLTAQEAYAQAKAWLCSQSAVWCTATNDQIRQHICFDDCTIYVGNDPVRLAICGTSTCPAPAPPPPPGGEMNTTLILGLVGLGVVAAVALAITGAGKKKVIIARTE